MEMYRHWVDKREGEWVTSGGIGLQKSRDCFSVMQDGRYEGEYGALYRVEYRTLRSK